LKSGNSQDESTTFPGHFLVHRLIAGGLPSDGWKFGPAMRGNPSADNELAVGFPRPLLQTCCHKVVDSEPEAAMNFTWAVLGMEDGNF
jgi:hypothetical protein